MTTLTIFTPTFNRENTLPRLFESLISQSDPSFRWLIVDDGSADGTPQLVSRWQAESQLKIDYIRQDNAGMLAAHNTAYDAIHTDLAVCVDSDDYLVVDAVEVIKRTWSRRDVAIDSVGLVGLDVLADGSVLGDAFPADLRHTRFKEIRFKLRLKGDKKYVYCMSAVNRAGRFPVIPGEKYPAASLLYRVLDQMGSLIVVNIPLCVVEYQDDGNSRQKVQQYKRSPNAFMEFRAFCMDDAFDIREAVTSAAHYVSAAIFAKRYLAPIINRHWYLTAPVIPIGVGLNLYLRFTTRKGFV